MGDAVAAILVLEDGRYLLQQRDDKPEIWYPGHWGMFGGSLDEGESELDALRRELREELELEIATAQLFAGFDFDLSPIGFGSVFRNYYEVRMPLSGLDRLHLHEGTELGVLTGEEALRLPNLCPYDGFALFLHHSRGRLTR
jgi:8-oxo-dGTP pyrophosphatase MutT (NUDIX family)